MKKVLSLIVLVLLVIGVVGCNGEEVERTYKADGVYMAYDKGTATQKVLNADGTEFKFGEGEAAVGFTAVVPTLTFVEVEIHNDEVVGFNIDERQSKVYVGSLNEDGSIKGLSIKFNDKTKKQLGWDYGMNKASKTDGEWFMSASKLEDSWLGLEEPVALSGVTMTQDTYVELAKKALENAVDGKVNAISRSAQNVREHYDYDFAFATADVNEEGKLSNVTFDAWQFGYNRNTFAEKLDTTNNVYNFTWNAETKYESYGLMGENSWQDMIDDLEDYIADNGWYFDLYSTTPKNPETNNSVHIVKADGVTKEVPTALASVTIEANGEITLLNTLNEYFPFGLKK